MSVGVVFQCGSCRALGIAGEVVVGVDGTSVGLTCAACASTTWLPVASAGSVSAEARSPIAAARALPPASSNTLPPPVTPSTTATPARSTDEDGAPQGVLAPPVSTSTLPTPAADVADGDVPERRPAAAGATTAAAATVKASATAPKPSPTTAGFDDDIRARIVERWKRLGDVSVEQAPLAARLERLACGAWSDEAEHKSLLKAASVAGELAFVGARYRAVLDVVRDEPRARAAQQELLTLAMLTMKGPRDLDDGAPRGKSKAYVAALVIATIGFLGAAGYFMLQMVESFRRLGELG